MRPPIVNPAMPAWGNGRRNPLVRRSRINWRTWLIVIVLLGALGVYAALPEAPFALGEAPLTGPVERVADGDTIEIGGQRIRLTGLDAPEWNQTCSRADGADWPCGRAATDRMRDLTRGAMLSCKGEGHDRYGRLLATCRAGDADIAESLVRDGLAVASGSYIRTESEARRAGRGIWQGRFDRPADWRATKTAEPQGNPSRFERFLAWLAGLFSS
ncbi:thermonuclease family protein [Devosia sp. CN2-171]|uniref:thermonuclease family protein n=1 Tax=Devosia sp. CN2-171 TaxID=3400909 RepID=UPI003BF7B75D